MIRKEKNMVYIKSTKYDGFYTIDINTGIVTDTRGKVVKTRNREIMEKLIDSRYNDNTKNAFYYALLNWFDNRPEVRQEQLYFLQCVEKIVNMGYKGCRYIDYECAIYAIEHSKDFAKWLTIGNNATEEVWVFTDYHRKELFRNKYGKYLSEQVSKGLDNSLLHKESFFNTQLTEKEKITYLCLLSKFVVPFFSEPKPMIYIPSNATQILMDMFRWAKLLEVEVDKGEFYKQYMAIKKMYTVKKSQLDNKALFENQMKHKVALAFSNEDFEVIIPTTEKEFENEANSQKNCVYSSYFPRVVDGRTNVVFIRRKSDLNTSYITCEVNDGVIHQYLGKHNTCVRDTKALEFKVAYAQHIRECWV